MLTLSACSGSDAGGPEESSYADGEGISVEVHPRLAHAGEDPAPADAAAYVIDAKLDEAEEGVEVQLQVDGEAGWTVVDEAETDAKGRASLTSAESGEQRVVTTDEDNPLGVHFDPAEDSPAPTMTDDFVDSIGAWVTRAQGYAGVRMCSRADDRAVRVKDGLLRLSVLDDPQRGLCTHKGERYAYRLNGHIGSEAFHIFRFGYAAARIRFQSPRGQHGAFWLQSYGLGTPGPASRTGAEIDVIEYFGDEHPQGGLTSFVYWTPPGGKSQTQGSWIADPEQYGEDWSSKFHVFSVEWTPREYVFRIDGEITRRIREGVSGQPEFLILSLLSSDYELQHIEDDELPVHMDVDWVRVWETPKTLKGERKASRGQGSPGRR
ncbi:glycoside hydrolase family 16 protein [Nocardioides gansuensis]|uniref:glycoside hydrolase family 16 protein n=1 Tax=Nocardioides gansuensis TaxID=2138300 RepID=UPI001057863B|nr:glycoside hydrolase family 16 protein [Nocardioides gansuensis]